MHRKAPWQKVMWATIWRVPRLTLPESPRNTFLRWLYFLKVQEEVILFNTISLLDFLLMILVAILGNWSQLFKVFLDKTCCSHAFEWRTLKFSPACWSWYWTHPEWFSGQSLGLLCILLVALTFKEECPLHTQCGARTTLPQHHDLHSSSCPRTSL